ncbi:hypothetical protein HGRIS_001898 [Hohenbuehelia grisea]|uniref:Uncharacterized protein n=1 Tax=Hohenbuehelia grisea TaxID=104357 RepID=A0ABR3JK41_9AGAR
MVGLWFVVSTSVTVGAGLASAQQLNLTSSCQNAFAGLLSQPDTAACLRPSALLSIATAGANASIISPINNWLPEFCNAGRCSNETLANATRSVLTGCSTDLEAIGAPLDVESTIITVRQLYTFRKVDCLKEGDALCITKTLTGIQDLLGPLTITSAINTTSRAFNDFNRNISCTNCMKAAWNVIAQDIPWVGREAAEGTPHPCGRSFTDGTMPSGITQSLTTATTPAGADSNSATKGIFGIQNTISGLVIIGVMITSSVYVLLFQS